MDPNQTQKSKWWLWVILIIVILAAAGFFYRRYLISTLEPIYMPPMSTPSDLSTPLSQTQQLENSTNVLDTDLTELDSELNQLDKIDANANEDIAPTL